MGLARLVEVGSTRVSLELARPVEDQWGVRILQFGFSNISPSPASLEITQLDLLAAERLELYTRFRKAGLAPGKSAAYKASRGNTIKSPSIRKL